MIHAHGQPPLVCFEDTDKLGQIRPTAGVWSFHEVTSRQQLATPQMDEVCPTPESAGHPHDIIALRARERPGTKGEPIVGIVHAGENPVNVLLVRDDARQTEDTMHRRVVWMDAKVNSILVTDRHDSLKEGTQILPENLSRDPVIPGEQLPELADGLRIVLVEVPADESLRLCDYRVDEG